MEYSNAKLEIMMGLDLGRSFVPPKQHKRPDPPAWDQETQLLEHLQQHDAREVKSLATAVRQSRDHLHDQRVLRYRGDRGEMLLATGARVVRANVAAVTIRDGDKLSQIPWHRVWDFSHHPDDPIGNF